MLSMRLFIYFIYRVLKFKGQLPIQMARGAVLFNRGTKINRKGISKGPFRET